MSVILQDARRLADFMASLDVQSYAGNYKTRSVYNHLGALLADIVLQSGLNYRNIVQPRVRRVLDEFFYASTTPLLKCVVNVYGAETFLNWKSPTKLRRFVEILEFLSQKGIDNEDEFRNYLSTSKNRNDFLKLNGVGPKTIDYALKLMGAECVAVDRHIFNFVKVAGVEAHEYESVKRIVEYAADLLSISRTGVDHFIWATMSESRSRGQISLAF